MVYAIFSWLFHISMFIGPIAVSSQVYAWTPAPIKNYSVISMAIKLVGKTNSYSALREWKSNQGDFYLVVDEQTLKTSIVPKAQTSKIVKARSNSLFSALKKRIRLRNKEVSRMKNTAPNRGYALTVDLCPSRKAWDYDLFQAVIKQGRIHKRPPPIGVAITGRWIKTFRKEFKQLLHWNHTKQLSIEWINHSYSHPLRPSASGQYQFMKASNVNITQEVLKLEKILIENGQAPSVWFRFPGLAYDKKTIQKITEMGLLPVGSNAWIAKKEKIKPNSIVLLHGNGNERKGVELYFSFLNSKAGEKLLPIKLSAGFRKSAD